jgi:hypothetical protein
MPVLGNQQGCLEQIDIRGALLDKLSVCLKSLDAPDNKII